MGHNGNRLMPGIGQNDLVSHLRSQFEVHGDTRRYTFLSSPDGDLVEDVATFRELDRNAREIAAWLATRPEANRPVLLLFEPGVDFWRAFLGCLYAGVIAIPAPLPHDQRSMGRVAGILRDADSNLALTTTKLRDLLAAGIEGLGLERPLLCVAIDDSPLADADAWTLPHLTADNVAFLQYTSGSTGDPKGVAVTHGNVLNNVAMISEAISVNADSVLVGWIPHFHDMGLISVVLGFFAGANLVVMSPIAFLKRPVRQLKAISDYRGTHTAAPNFAYNLIARRVTPEQLADLDLSTLEVALNGAEPVRRATMERINDLLAPAGFAPSAMRPAYGMAEVTLMATVSRGVQRYLDADADALEQNRYTPATGRAVSLASSGEPGPGIDVRIVDPETLHVLPDDHVGEIWLRSASVASGYHNRPAQTVEEFRCPHLRRRWPLPAHRRPRAAPRGRALRHRPPQGPAHRQRPQPVPAGHRGVRAGRAPGLGRFTGSRDFGRHQRRRMPRPDPGRQAPLAGRRRATASSPRQSRPPSRGTSRSRLPAWCLSTTAESTSPPAERCSAHRCGLRS